MYVSWKELNGPDGAKGPSRRAATVVSATLAKKISKERHINFFINRWGNKCAQLSYLATL